MTFGQNLQEGILKLDDSQALSEIVNGIMSLHGTLERHLAVELLSTTEKEVFKEWQLKLNH